MKEQTITVTSLKAVRSIPYTHSAVPLQVVPERQTPVFSLCARLCLSIRRTLWTSNHLSRINPNLIYRKFLILFWYRTLSIRFVISKWSNICPCRQCTILIFWPQSRCVTFLHLVVSKNFAFQLYHKKWPLFNIVWNSITCVILHRGSNINLISQK
jgi:hypothetical protein